MNGGKSRAWFYFFERHDFENAMNAIKSGRIGIG
jgi:hypothetical protein